MVKYFSSTLAELPGSLGRCLEQLFCRKPVSACFLRKELHSRRYYFIIIIELFKVDDKKIYK